VRKLLEFLETTFTVVCLTLYTGGPLTVIVKGGASEGDGQLSSGDDTALIRLVFILIYIVTFFLLLIWWKKTLYVLTQNKNIVLLVLLTAFSLLWSVSPSITLSRVFAFAGTTLFGIYLSVRYNSLKKSLLIISLTLGLVIFLSLLFSVGLPKYGVMSGLHAGSWRGIYFHKNAFGKWMALSMIICLINCPKNKKISFIWYVALALSVVMLFLAKSSASLIVAFGLVIIFSILSIFRLKYELMFPAVNFTILLVTITTTWIMDNADAILGTFGKDATLTGRKELWQFLIDMALRRPLLGYGYGAFWGVGSASEEVWKAFSWSPPNAHNGYIDTWLNIGLIGLLIFFIGFLRNLAISFILIRRYGTPEVLFPFILLVYIAISNYSESGLMLQNDFIWVIYVYLSYLLPKSCNKLIST
jgi:exopolysaccharide production protein ExoQ